MKIYRWFMTPLHSGVGVIIVISQIIIIIFELAGGILIVTILVSLSRVIWILIEISIIVLSWISRIIIIIIELVEFPELLSKRL